MSPTMDLPDEARAEAKLKVLIRHLVLHFPQAAILSRQVGDRYHVFVIVPYEGGGEKAIQVERALLLGQHPTADEFSELVDVLSLPILLQTCERYDLCQASWSQKTQRLRPRPVVSGRKAENSSPSVEEASRCS